jgi:hypothetical protein
MTSAIFRVRLPDRSHPLAWIAVARRATGLPPTIATSAGAA